MPTKSPEQLIADCGAWWDTSIIDIRPGRIAIRGYPIEELIGNVRFPVLTWLMPRVGGSPRGPRHTMTRTRELPSSSAPAHPRLAPAPGLRAIIVGSHHDRQSATRRPRAFAGLGLSFTWSVDADATVSPGAVVVLLLVAIYGLAAMARFAFAGGSRGRA